MLIGSNYNTENFASVKKLMVGSELVVVVSPANKLNIGLDSSTVTI